MKYRVNIEEILSRVIEVEADNPEDAEYKAEQMYKNEEVVLDANDLQEIKFYESGIVIR